MPIQINRSKMLDLKPGSGELDGVKENQKVMNMAFVQDCLDQICPIRDRCSEEYKHKGKCVIERQYLNKIFYTWTDEVEGIGDIITQGQLFRLGAHIMPLYSIHIKLLKELWGTQRIVTKDKWGAPRINPILKEIRDTSKSIGSELKEAGMEETWVAKWGNKKPVPVGGGAADAYKAKFGNVDRYADMKTNKKEEDDA